MTKNTVKRADITLPLLIEYIDVLLPSLSTQVESNTEQNSEHAEVLWVIHNDTDLSELQIQLKGSVATNHTEMNAEMNTEVATELTFDTCHLSTLSELAKQHVPERYELACFWLPDLSEELIQHYIPLLMRYRDLYAAHLLVALDSSVDLKPYGFTPFDILNEPSVDVEEVHAIISSQDTAKLWQFNLYDYKQLPNWLNADYWANPENWGKHRW